MQRIWMLFIKYVNAIHVSDSCHAYECCPKYRNAIHANVKSRMWMPSIKNTNAIHAWHETPSHTCRDVASLRMSHVSHTHVKDSIRVWMPSIECERDLTHLFVWHDSKYVRAWPDSFIRVTWLIICVSVTGLIYWCDMTQNMYGRDLSHLLVWHDSKCVTWLICVHLIHIICGHRIFTAWRMQRTPRNDADSLLRATWLEMCNMTCPCASNVWYV